MKCSKKSILTLVALLLFSFSSGLFAAVETAQGNSKVSQEEKKKDELEKKKREKTAKALAFAKKGTVQKLNSVSSASKASEAAAVVARVNAGASASRRYK